MSHSDREGSPIQPDGGLLSVLGDLLFAGAILLMIYPFLRRTVDRMDRQFFYQLIYILEVLLAVAAVCFVLMLVIAQQLRVTYCSFIRPYVGDKPEDKAYAGTYLKILVCALLVFNYFCASGLQRIVTAFFQWFRPGGAGTLPNSDGRFLSARGKYRRGPRSFTSREVLTNNSNTNSQTPVTHTLTHSDTLPSMSFPVINSDSFQEHDTSSHVVREQRLYRDVGTMVRFPEYQSGLCTLQFCRGVMTDSPALPLSCPVPCSSSSYNCAFPPPSTPGSSLRHPAFTTTSTGFVNSAGGFQSRVDPKLDSSVHCDLSSSSVLSGGQSGGLGLVSSVHNSCHLNAANVHSHISTNSAPTSVPSAPNQFGQTAPVSVRSSGLFEDPSSSGRSGQTSFCRINETATSSVSDVAQPSLQCPSYVHHRCSHGNPSSQSQNVCVLTQSHSSNFGSGGSASCSHSTAATFSLPRQRSNVQVRRRRQLPSMPKMTRSGKIYGYG